MRRTRIVALAAGAAALASVLTACGDESSSDDVGNPATAVLFGGHVAVFTEIEPCCDAGGGVGIEGVLSVVAGCLGYREGDADPTVILFPDGTSVSGEGPDLVVTVDGVDLRIGDGFAGGSRSSDRGTVTDFGELREQAPASCRALLVRQLDEVSARPDIAIVG